jgi:iron(III) transport system substrate-binding protein
VRKKDPSPAAKAFLDWAAGPSAFAHYAKYCAVVSHERFRTPPPGYPPDPLGQLADVDLRRAARDRERVLNEWNRRYGGKSEAK